MNFKTKFYVFLCFFTAFLFCNPLWNSLHCTQFLSKCINVVRDVAEFLCAIFYHQRSTNVVKWIRKPCDDPCTFFLSGLELLILENTDNNIADILYCWLKYKKSRAYRQNRALSAKMTFNPLNTEINNHVSLRHNICSSCYCEKPGITIIWPSH